MVSVDHAEGEPVVGGAFCESHPEHDDADQDEFPVGPHGQVLAQALTPRPLLRCAGFRVAEFDFARDEPHGQHGGRHHQHGQPHQVPRDVDVQGCGRGADSRADDGAEAEAGVHERHERLADLAFDGRAFDVHHHVDHPVAEAEQRKAESDDRHEVDERHTAADQHHADCHDDEGDDHAAVRADFCEQRCGSDETQDGADGHSEDEQADLGCVQPEPVADAGDTRDPGRNAQSAQDEDGEHRIAPRREFASAARRECWCRLRHDVPDGSNMGGCLTGDTLESIRSNRFD